MGRRQFILALAAAGLIRPSQGQQQKLPLLAILSPASRNAQVLGFVNRPFKEALAKLGYEPGRESPHLSTRQYSRIVGSWVGSIGLDPAAYGTHSLRRTKPTLIYRRTRNLRAVQLLLGHTKLESTVRYL